jgi:hypothetical protein
MTHSPSTLFLKYHDHRRRIGVGTRMNKTHFKKFLNNFPNFIILGKGMMIRENIGRNISQYERNGMIMDTMGRGESLGVVKTTWCLERIDWRSGCT